MRYRWEKSGVVRAEAEPGGTLPQMTLSEARTVFMEADERPFSFRSECGQLLTMDLGTLGFGLLRAPVAVGTALWRPRRSAYLRPEFDLVS